MTRNAETTRMTGLVRNLASLDKNKSAPQQDRTCKETEDTGHEPNLIHGYTIS